MAMPTGLRPILVAAALTLPATAACGGEASPAAPEDLAAALVTVDPAGGAEEVSVRTNVVVGFDGPMMPGMEAYAMLHRGGVTGPEVEGAWTLSPDRRMLRFTPSTELEPHTLHTVHLGAGMMDAEGHYADLERHGPQMGGTWATGEMMEAGSGQGSGMGSGMGGAMGGDHMGTGWQHPSNGSYGMIFSFTTGA